MTNTEQKPRIVIDIRMNDGTIVRGTGETKEIATRNARKFGGVVGRWK